MGKYAKGGPGSGVKGHKTAKKDVKKIVSYDKVSMYDLGFGKDGKAGEKWFLDHGWEFDKQGEVQVSSGYGVPPVYDVYLDKEGKAVAAAIVSDGLIEHLEVNKAERGKGVGTKIMADIAVELLKEGKGETIILNSQGDESNKFYDAIGMRKTNEDWEDYVPEDDPEGDDVYYEGSVEWQKEFVKTLLGEEVSKVVSSEIDVKGSFKYDPLVGTKKGKVEDLLKAAMAGAVSGEAGYVPIPYAYDEEGEPKKKVDKILDTIIKQMYEGMKEKVDDSVEYLLRE
jgi:GNAT superfamily N-acetyltransferase